MKKVKRGKTFHNGNEIIDVETNEILGLLSNSVGPYGESTGIFEMCETSTPFNELGLKWIDEPTAPWE